MKYRTYVGLFLGAFVLCYLVVPLVRRLALSLGAYDPLSARRVHGRRVPNLGGLAPALALYAGIGALYLWPNVISERFFSRQSEVGALLVGGGFMVVLGVWDDLKGADAKLKFAVQTLAAVVVCMWAGPARVVSVPVLGEFSLGLLAVPFTVLWIVAVTNAFNMIDGVDGLAAGVAIVVCAVDFFLALDSGAVGMMVFAALMAGALLGFLRHNYHPASIFLGDTGSLFVGFTIGVTALYSSMKTPTAVALALPLALLGYPLLDLSLAVARRVLKGSPLFHADRSHLHHRLLDCGLGHPGAMMVGCLVASLSALVAIFHSYGHHNVVAVLLLVLAVGLVAMFRALGYWDSLRRQVCLRRRRKCQTSHMVGKIAELRGKDVEGTEQSWTHFCWACRELEVVRTWAELDGENPPAWKHPDPALPMGADNHTIHLADERGTIHVIHRDGKDEDLRREQNTILEKIARKLFSANGDKKQQKRSSKSVKQQTAEEDNVKNDQNSKREKQLT